MNRRIQDHRVDANVLCSGLPKSRALTRTGAGVVDLVLKYES